MKRNSLGFNLLELLLVIAVASTLMLLAVRYFSASRIALKVTNSVAQIQKISTASHEWLNGQSQLDFSNANNGTAITLNTLINANYLTDTANDTQDAWGETIIIQADTNDPSYVQINLPGVPSTACNNLKQHLTNVARDQLCNEDGYFGSF